MGSSIDFSLYVDGLEKCDKQTALSIFQDKSIVKALGFETVDIKDISCFYIFENKALVFLKEKENGLIEIHICCPWKNRAGIKDLFKKGIQSLKSIDGCREIYTTAPDERHALVNMLKSLGFQKKDTGWVV